MPTEQMRLLYASIEENFTMILASPTLSLDCEQRDYVRSIVAHREYDDALGNLMAIMLDDTSSLTSNDIEVLTRINGLMSLKEPDELVRLRQRVDSQDQPQVMHR